MLKTVALPHLPSGANFPEMVIYNTILHHRLSTLT